MFNASGVSGWGFRCSSMLALLMKAPSSGGRVCGRRGAAGITIALDLMATGLSVILLESGGRQRETETQVLSEDVC